MYPVDSLILQYDTLPLCLSSSLDWWLSRMLNSYDNLQPTELEFILSQAEDSFTP